MDKKSMVVVCGGSQERVDPFYRHNRCGLGFGTGLSIGSDCR